MQNNNIEVQVLVSNKTVAEYRHDTGRFFVEGKEESEYSLRIKNHNDSKIMVVVGVDGVNVIDSKPIGSTGTEGKKEAGYLIDANDSLTIKGYRLNNDEVAAFKFTKADQAYASKDKKLSGTTGVIGVRAYLEKEKPKPAPQPVIIREDHHHYHRPWYNDHYWRKDFTYTTPMWGSSAIACSAGAGQSTKCSSDMGGILRGMSASAHQSDVSFSNCSNLAPQEASADSNPFSLGSSWGQKTESKVREVAFEVGNFLTEVLLYYTTREGLKTLGIDLTRAAQVSFPDHSPGKFCQQPSGWTG